MCVLNEPHVNLHWFRCRKHQPNVPTRNHAFDRVLIGNHTTQTSLRVLSANRIPAKNTTRTSHFFVLLSCSYACIIASPLNRHLHGMLCSQYISEIQHKIDKCISGIVVISFSQMHTEWVFSKNFHYSNVLPYLFCTRKIHKKNTIRTSHHSNVPFFSVSECCLVRASCLTPIKTYMRCCVADTFATYKTKQAFSCKTASVLNHRTNVLNIQSNTIAQLSEQECVSENISALSKFP